MNYKKKDFFYHAALVVISALLTFLLEYIKEISKVVPPEAVAGGITTVGIALRKHILV